MRSLIRQMHDLKKACALLEAYECATKFADDAQKLKERLKLYEKFPTF